jgi:Spy/CpxP family protein refolding chaperone
MSSKQKFVSALTLALACLTFNVFVSAQEKTTTPSTDSAQSQEKRERRGPERRGEGGPGMGGHHGPRGPEKMLRALSRLDLSEAQKEQVHTILESKRAGFEQTREQLREFGRAKHEGTITAEQQAKFDELRAQMKQNAEAVHEQILGLLTAEQRAKLEQFKAEMDKRREERRLNGPRHGRGQGAPPADKPKEDQK